MMVNIISKVEVGTTTGIIILCYIWIYQVLGIRFLFIEKF